MATGTITRNTWLYLKKKLNLVQLRDHQENTVIAMEIVLKFMQVCVPLMMP
jgi:hypothetical protein